MLSFALIQKVFSLFFVVKLGPRQQTEDYENQKEEKKANQSVDYFVLKAVWKEKFKFWKGEKCHRFNISVEHHYQKYNPERKLTKKLRNWSVEECFESDIEPN